MRRECDKSLLFRAYKELSKLSKKKINIPVRKWARHFTEKDKSLAISTRKDAL